jgi:Na+(H+)/acetate symporter ActP
LTSGTIFAFLAPPKKRSAEGAALDVGVFVVGAVITLNVALGGMKGITLVQAFQYWLKMFAISVPIFALMSVYGHYGKQVGANSPHSTFNVQYSTNALALNVESLKLDVGRSPLPDKAPKTKPGSTPLVR